MAMDPICRMVVDEDTTEWKREYKGAVYHFCSSACMGDFNENPDFYHAGGLAPRHNCSCCGP